MSKLRKWLEGREGKDGEVCVKPDIKVEDDPEFRLFGHLIGMSMKDCQANEGKHGANEKCDIVRLESCFEDISGQRESGRQVDEGTVDVGSNVGSCGSSAASKRRGVSWKGCGLDAIVAVALQPSDEDTSRSPLQDEVNGSSSGSTSGVTAFDAEKRACSFHGGKLVRMEAAQAVDASERLRESDATDTQNGEQAVTMEVGEDGRKSCEREASGGDKQKGAKRSGLRGRKGPTSVRDSNGECAEEIARAEAQQASVQGRLLQKPDGVVPCPRCDSLDTKFCYYNNYNVNQPRHFCKNCQRYWTAGGVLRNVPVGAGRRKNKQALAAVAALGAAGTGVGVGVSRRAGHEGEGAASRASLGDAAHMQNQTSGIVGGTAGRSLGEGDEMTMLHSAAAESSGQKPSSGMTSAPTLLRPVPHHAALPEYMRLAQGLFTDMPTDRKERSMMDWGKMMAMGWGMGGGAPVRENGEAGQSSAEQFGKASESRSEGECRMGGGGVRDLQDDSQVRSGGGVNGEDGYSVGDRSVSGSRMSSRGVSSMEEFAMGGVSGGGAISGMKKVRSSGKLSCRSSMTSLAQQSHEEEVKGGMNPCSSMVGGGALADWGGERAGCMGQVGAGMPGESMPWGMQGGPPMGPFGFYGGPWPCSPYGWGGSGGPVGPQWGAAAGMWSMMGGWMPPGAWRAQMGASWGMTGGQGGGDGGDSQGRCSADMAGGGPWGGMWPGGGSWQGAASPADSFGTRRGGTGLVCGKRGAEEMAGRSSMEGSMAETEEDGGRCVGIGSGEVWVPKTIRKGEFGAMVKEDGVWKPYKRGSGREEWACCPDTESTGARAVQVRPRVVNPAALARSATFQERS